MTAADGGFNWSMQQIDKKFQPPLQMDGHRQVPGQNGQWAQTKTGRY
jgi:hypothetical protein